MAPIGSWESMPQRMQSIARHAWANSCCLLHSARQCQANAGSTLIFHKTVMQILWISLYFCVPAGSIWKFLATLSTHWIYRPTCAAALTMKIQRWSVLSEKLRCHTFDEERGVNTLRRNPVLPSQAPIHLLQRSREGTVATLIVRSSPSYALRRNSSQLDRRNSLMRSCRGDIRTDIKRKGRRSKI